MKIDNKFIEVLNCQLKILYAVNNYIYTAYS